MICHSKKMCHRLRTSSCLKGQQGGMGLAKVEWDSLLLNGLVDVVNASISPYHLAERCRGTVRPRSPSLAGRKAMAVLTRGGPLKPTQKSNYELFNCDNIKHRYLELVFPWLLAPDLPSNEVCVTP